MYNSIFFFSLFFTGILLIGRAILEYMCILINTFHSVVYVKDLKCMKRTDTDFDFGPFFPMVKKKRAD